MKKVTKVVYDPSFDRMFLLEIEEGKEKQKVHFLVDEALMTHDLETLATLTLINETVVLGDL